MRFNSEEYDMNDIYNDDCADLTVDNFIDWLRTMPPKEEVDHGCGWNSCAVGMFIASTSSCPSSEYGYDEYFDALKDYFTDGDGVWGGYGTDEHMLYEYLNHCYGATYGDIVRFVDADYDDEQEEFVAEYNDEAAAYEAGYRYPA